MKYICALLLAALLAASSQAQLTPAVAANMKFAYAEIATLFTKQTGIEVAPVYGSSGKLVTQIRNGAPYDLFVSADVGFADSICVSNLAIGKPKIYAFGKLVLWTAKKIDIADAKSVFSNPAVKSVALGDMKLTAYGPAAKNYLDKVKLWPVVEKKVVYGENIAKVAQFISSGAADVGFCAKSIVLSDEMKGVGSWAEIDSTAYDPLPQASVMLVYGEDNNSGPMRRLYDFLYTPEARSIMLRYGYTVP